MENKAPKAQRPNLARSITDPIDERLSAFTLMGCPTRAEAAQTLIRWMPDWYFQTPEGEYLEWIASGGQYG